MAVECVTALQTLLLGWAVEQEQLWHAGTKEMKTVKSQSVSIWPPENRLRCINGAKTSRCVFPLQRNETTRQQQLENTLHGNEMRLNCETQTPLLEGKDFMNLWPTLMALKTVVCRSFVLIHSKNILFPVAFHINPNKHLTAVVLFASDSPRHRSLKTSEVITGLVFYTCSLLHQLNVMFDLTCYIYLLSFTFICCSFSSSSVYSLYN